jgi:hypothetical protein
MDFEVTYTEEQQRFRAEVRAWFEANVPPGITRGPASPAESYQNYQMRRELVANSGPRVGCFRRPKGIWRRRSLFVGPTARTGLLRLP